MKTLWNKYIIFVRTWRKKYCELLVDHARIGRGEDSDSVDQVMVRI